MEKFKIVGIKKISERPCYDRKWEITAISTTSFRQEIFTITTRDTEKLLGLDLEKDWTAYEINSLNQKIYYD